ncbi:MAG TPA: Crp/Fnr family transcriptional regulator [Mucilaginibacter sp.]|nr:Crp/Fnr family transcriptional regulator [Mucilaginibacter sp.]
MFEVFRKYIEGKTSLTEEQYGRLQSLCIIKKLRKKQYLLQEGDSWKYHTFITKGCMRTYSIDEKGLEHIIYFGLENWWIGDKESLMFNQPSKYNIDAIEDSEVVLFTDPNFNLACKEIPAFNDMINNILQRSFAVSQNRLQAAISYTAEEKYLNFLNKYPGFATRIPQSMIASYLGITPETLSRVRNLSAKK